MNFEIYGVGFVNKGAELMMHSIIQQLKEWNFNNKIAVNLKTGKFSQRERAGLFTILWAQYKRAPYFGKFISNISGYLPNDLLKKFKLIKYSDIDVILDASGFAYSDQWGTESISNLLVHSRKWRESGKKIIFLPQAFGPFNIEQNRLSMREIIDNVDLIYARDGQSFSHLNQMVDESPKIKLSPDFTVLIQGIVPEYAQHSQNLACLVPNARMIDRQNSLDQERYLKFFLDMNQYLAERGFEVVILIHELNDSKLAQQLQLRTGRKNKIIVEQDPIILKGLLGHCKVVIGSRYHALVSSLSQGVPTLGTSWSHKYQALFDDYKCPEYLLSGEETMAELETRINLMVSEPKRSNLINNLYQVSRNQKKQTIEMWDDIYNLLHH